MKKLILFLLLAVSPCFASWTATPTEKAFESETGKLRIDVAYTNGDAKYRRVHRVDTYAQFVAEVRAEVARLEGVDNSSTQIAVGVPVDVSVKPAPQPTQDELDRQAFSVLVRNYRDRKAELDAKLGGTTQADIDALIAQMKSAYKEEYASLIVGLF